jgi:hypothetical protein
MTTLKPIIETLGAELITAPPGWETRGVCSAFVSDLISDILIADGDSILLITSLLSDQVLRAAGVIGASAIILANRKDVPASLGKAAERQGLALFHTPLPKFETCIRIGRLMEKA